MTPTIALTSCLKLALVAKTQDQVDRAVELAEQIAAGMTADEVNAAKEAACLRHYNRRGSDPWLHSGPASGGLCN